MPAKMTSEGAVQRQASIHRRPRDGSDPRVDASKQWEMPQAWELCTKGRSPLKTGPHRMTGHSAINKPMNQLLSHTLTIVYLHISIVLVATMFQSFIDTQTTHPSARSLSTLLKSKVPAVYSPALLSLLSITFFLWLAKQNAIAHCQGNQSTV